MIPKFGAWVPKCGWSPVQKRHSGGKRDVAVKATGLFRLQNMDETPGVVPYPLGEVKPIKEWSSMAAGQGMHVPMHEMP